MNLPDLSKNSDVCETIRRALDEDIGAGDITTDALLSKSAKAKAVIISQEECVMAGIGISRLIFEQVDPRLRFKALFKDGQRVRENEIVAEISGYARGILMAERTALNFLQRMSGIATLTNKFVKKVKKYRVTILDTRKTTPGLRVFEKYAVLCGGGKNHRMGLYDRILIKDNHLNIISDEYGIKSMDIIVKKAKEKHISVPVEIEVDNEKELKLAAKRNPDWILLDNMTANRLKRCVRIVRGKVLLEASGGITLANVENIAKTGIDAISLGCLTHSAPAIDFSLEIVQCRIE